MRLKETEEEELLLKERGLFADKYHYLGNAQWDYCRSLLSLSAGVDEREEEVSDHLHRMASFIDMIEQIYNDNSARRPAFTGGPDTYRRRRYRVDW